MYAKTSDQIVLFQVNQLKLQTQTALMGQFNHPKRSIVSQYGALTALIALGPQVLESCVWPQMDKYLNSLESKFNEKGQIVMSNGHSLQDRPTPYSNKMQDLALIWGTFLLAARSMLHSANSTSIQDNSIKDNNCIHQIYQTIFKHFGDSVLCNIPLPKMKTTNVSPDFESSGTRLRIRPLPCSSGSSAPRSNLFLIEFIFLFFNLQANL